MKARIATNLNERNSSPSLDHLFGTDWLGRDMFTRTIMGLSLSMGVGLIGAIGSASIALILGMAAATMGKMVDRSDFMAYRPFSKCAASCNPYSYCFYIRRRI